MIPRSVQRRLGNNTEADDLLVLVGTFMQSLVND